MTLFDFAMCLGAVACVAAGHADGGTFVIAFLCYMHVRKPV